MEVHERKNLLRAKERERKRISKLYEKAEAPVSQMNKLNDRLAEIENDFATKLAKLTALEGGDTDGESRDV